MLNVIGGWFFTAISAFLAAATVAYLINWNVTVMVPILLLIAVLLLVRNYISHKNKTSAIKAEDSLTKAESRSIQGVIHESANNIANVVKRGNKIYSNAINGLAFVITSYSIHYTKLYEVSNLWFRPISTILI